MKILLIDVSYGYGSTGKIVELLKKGYEKKGHEVVACYGRGKNIHKKNIYKFGIDIETLMHALLSRLTGLMGYFSYFSTRKLKKIIEKYNPNVVHIHETHSYFINYLDLINFLKEKEIKTVWTFHCEYMYTGNCGYAYDCEKWKSECRACPDKKRYPKSLFFDCSKKIFNDKKKAFSDFKNLTIVTPSEWLTNRVKQSFLKDKIIKTVYNGVDTDIFRPSDYDDLKEKYFIGNKKVVLSVAPDIMSSRKGGKWIVKLAEKLVDKNIIFILIGVREFKQKFPKNIIALPIIKDQIKLAKFYSMADVFVLCSERETFSMTCAEAISCGTNIVGFKSGAPETIFKEGKFVTYGDLNSLQEILLNSLRDNKNTNILDIEKYSADRMVDEYLKLFN